MYSEYLHSTKIFNEYYKFKIQDIKKNYFFHTILYNSNLIILFNIVHV
jgi:hypothetical protein